MFSFFARKTRKPRGECKSDRWMKRMVAGMIIGGAIGSVVGKKLLDQHEEEFEVDENEKD